MMKVIALLVSLLTALVPTSTYVKRTYCGCWEHREQGPLLVSGKLKDSSWCVSTDEVKRDRLWCAEDDDGFKGCEIRPGELAGDGFFDCE